METNIPFSNKAGSCRCFPKRHEPLHRCCAAAIRAPTFLLLCAELQTERTRFLPPGFIPHTVLFPLDTSIPILSMGIPSFLIKYCNASAPAYYDSIWFVTRTRHSRSNLLNRIFICSSASPLSTSSARSRRTCCISSIPFRCGTIPTGRCAASPARILCPVRFAASSRSRRRRWMRSSPETAFLAKGSAPLGAAQYAAHRQQRSVKKRAYVNKATGKLYILKRTFLSDAIAKKRLTKRK